MTDPIRRGPITDANRPPPSIARYTHTSPLLDDEDELRAFSPSTPVLTLGNIARSATVDPETQRALDVRASEARSNIRREREDQQKALIRSGNEAMGLHALNSLAFNLGPEAVAAYEGAYDAATGRGSFSDTYARRERQHQARLDRLAAENPEQAAMGMVGGALAQGLLLPTAVAGKGASLLWRLGKPALMGAAINAANAAGAARGDIWSRLRAARNAAPLGAVLGGVIPAADLPATRLGRVGATGLAGAITGAAIGNERSKAPTLSQRASDVLPWMLGGAAAGVGGRAAVEGADELIDMYRGASTPESLRARAAEIDEYAAPFRTRSAGARTLGYQRLADELPGGIPRVAEQLHERGIMPRGTIFFGGSMDDAAARAARVEAETGAGIGSVRAQMEELAPRGTRDLPSLGREPGQVSREPMISAYDEIADRLRGIQGGATRREAAEALSQEARDLGPMTFEQAQRQKEMLDEADLWFNPPPGERVAALVKDRREVRRALANAQDAAVLEDLGADAAAQYRADREGYQLSNLFRRMAKDNELRETANRVASMSDYQAWQGAAAQGGPWYERLGAAALNKALRGREASMVAGTAERFADRLRLRADTLEAAQAGGGGANLAERILSGARYLRPSAYSLAPALGAYGRAPHPVPTVAVAAPSPEADRITIEDFYRMNGAYPPGYAAPNGSVPEPLGDELTEEELRQMTYQH